jgi:acyl-CoA reductase-like NAD-dependent aldehyde dehydrogenase
MVTIAQRMYIDGRWRDAEGDGVFDVVDPATRKMIERVPDASAADVRSAVDAADRAFPAWAATPAKERGRILARIQARLESETEAIARLIVLENGKPFEEAKKEVAFALGYFGWFGEEARRLAGEWVPSPVPGKRLLVLRQPVGPVAAITPWNFPATMVTRKIAPALAAGCTVVLKPASATPLTALALARACHDAGLPPADGARADGFFYSPTVLTDVSDDMPVCREEIFGPVAPVLTFETEEEVLRRANDTTFGLAGYFYTWDPARLLRVAEGLEYGLVGANDASGYTHEIPFGGFKASGLGREGGHQGIEEYTEVKSVVIGLG